MLKNSGQKLLQPRVGLAAVAGRVLKKKKLGTPRGTGNRNRDNSCIDLVGDVVENYTV